jgi:hypothetical protein
MALQGRKSIHGWPLPSPEEARQGLQRLTGQDFGYDAGRWSEWLKKNRAGLYKGAAWAAATDPGGMLQLLRGKASQRKLRLFACGCARSVGHLAGDQRSHDAVVVAERFADGKATRGELAEAGRASRAAAQESRFFSEPSVRAAREAAHYVTRVAAGAAACGAARVLDRPLGCTLLREVFANPFRQVPLEWPRPVCGTVRRLAEAIYNDRDFQSLPVLADALEEAGCAAPDILNHCRLPGVHVMGCWAVDLVLANA